MSTNTIGSKAMARGPLADIPRLKFLLAIIALICGFALGWAIAAPGAAYAQEMPRAAYSCYPYLPSGTGTTADNATQTPSDDPSVSDLSTVEVDFDALWEAIDITDTGYGTTGEVVTEHLDIVGADGQSLIYPDNINVFWFESGRPFPHDATYCLLIQTSVGTYFVAQATPVPDDVENYVGYCSLQPDDDFDSFVLYYCPATLEEYLALEEGDGEEQMKLLENWTRVTNDNADSIPFPNPQSVSEDKPLNILVSHLIYTAPAYPTDALPLPTLEGLYDTATYASYSVTEPNQFTDNVMVEGQVVNPELALQAGAALAWLDIENTPYYYSVGGVVSDDSYPTQWRTPADSEMCFVGYNERDEYVVTDMALIPVDENYQLEKEDIEIAYPGKDQTELYYTVPLNNYSLEVTKIAPYPGPDGFVDVAQGSWYYTDVVTATTLGYVHGCNALFFDPNANITRGQIATMLFNMSGWTEDDYDVAKEIGNDAPSFPDVTTKDYFYKPVEWAVTNGIVAGYDLPTGKVFDPNGNTTREQLMTMVWRYAQLEQGKDFVPVDEQQIEEALARFTDGGQVSAWAREAVAWCVANDIVTGYKYGNGSTVLAPLAPITRAETTAIGVRLQPEARTSLLGI